MTHHQQAGREKLTNPDNDPDETEGRRLARERAEAVAYSDLSIGRRKIKLEVDDPGRPVPHHGSGPVTVGNTNLAIFDKRKFQPRGKSK